MSKFSHLRALLKKNLLIFKSTFILTTVEILSPIVVMLLLLGLKTLFDKEVLPLQEDLEYIINNSSFLTNKYEKVTFNKISYRGSIFMCQERNLIGLVGENFPEELYLKFLSHMWENNNIYFKYFKNLTTLFDYV